MDYLEAVVVKEAEANSSTISPSSCETSIFKNLNQKTPLRVFDCDGLSLCCRVGELSRCIYSHLKLKINYKCKQKPFTKDDLFMISRTAVSIQGKICLQMDILKQLSEN